LTLPSRGLKIRFLWYYKCQISEEVAIHLLTGGWDVPRGAIAP